VIKQAPLFFTATVVVLFIIIGYVEYLFFKTNIDNKNDLIKTLQDKIAQSETITPNRSEIKRPEFHLLIFGANVFVSGASDMRPLTGIALATKVWNTGEPSVTTEWNLAIIPQGQAPVIAQLTKIPEHLKLEGPINSTVVRSTDALDEKTARNPVEKGPIEGVLLFYVPLPKSTVQAKTTRWELSVKDLYGVETLATKTMDEWLAR